MRRRVSVGLGADSHSIRWGIQMSSRWMVASKPGAPPPAIPMRTVGPLNACLFTTRIVQQCGFGLLLLRRCSARHRLFYVICFLIPRAAGFARNGSINPLMREGRSLVAIVYGTEPGRMLRRALELLGGIDRLGLRGHRVFY